MDDGSSGCHAVRGVRRDKSGGRDATGQRLAGMQLVATGVFARDEGVTLVTALLAFRPYLDISFPSLCRCFTVEPPLRALCTVGTVARNTLTLISVECRV